MRRIRRSGRLPFLILLFCTLGLQPAHAAHLTTEYLVDRFPDGYQLDFSKDLLTGKYDPFDFYDVQGDDLCVDGRAGDPGLVFLQPREPVPLHAVSREFFEVLTGSYLRLSGWRYTLPDGETPLVPGEVIEGGLQDDSLVVHTYDAQHPQPNLVGAQFHVEYTGNAPSHIHWIQVLWNNHREAGHGVEAAGVDVGGANLVNPFYDYDKTLAADENNFYDRPGRPDDCNNHDWKAELWVVTSPWAEDTGPTAISFYGGVAWGWGNRVACESPEPTLCDVVPVPELPTWLLVGTGGLMLFGVGRQATKPKRTPCCEHIL